MILSTTTVNSTCGNANGSIDLTVTGGTPAYTYMWSTGATIQDPIGLLAGTYTVTVTDANGCTKTTTATINNTGGPSLGAVVTNILCNGASTGAINLTVTGGTNPITFLWSSGHSTEDISNISGGVYTVTVTDANNCIAITSATVTEPTAIVLSTSQFNILCNGASTGAINLTATGGTGAKTYLWSSGQTTEDLTNIAAGTYTVTATDVNGCTKTTSATVTQPPAISLNTSVINVLCNGASTGSIDLTVAGGVLPYSYLWTNGFTAQDPSGLPAGIYMVTVTDGNGCTKTTSATISQPPAIDLSTVVTNGLCNSATTGVINLTVTGGTGNKTFLWSSGQTTEDISDLTAGTYTVTVTDANGCTKTTSATISQPSAIVLGAVVTNGAKQQRFHRCDQPDCYWRPGHKNLPLVFRSNDRRHQRSGSRHIHGDGHGRERLYQNDECNSYSATCFDFKYSSHECTVQRRSYGFNQPDGQRRYRFQNLYLVLRSNNRRFEQHHSRRLHGYSDGRQRLHQNDQRYSYGTACFGIEYDND
ncbi:MAG: SprB repeat-containing protein [Lewinellaceae bacterium]|nr:SprB repeat-containing protein [Lewinellaceae bacterium]